MKGLGAKEIAGAKVLRPVKYLFPLSLQEVSYASPALRHHPPRCNAT
jgi:hypothetical protein